MSPVADVAFRNTGKGKVEPASIHGTGGVTVDGNEPAREASGDSGEDGGR